MVEVTPSRSFVSDRFPVASFVVHAPPERIFEIACTTHAALLAPENRARRTAENFYSSRAEGLMRAPQGSATWLMPSEQLIRFAGASRLFYAVAHYGGVRGEDVQLSVPVDRPDATPFIRLATDFTGSALDRRRFGAKATNGARYGSGARPGSLVWGGDVAVRKRYGDREPDGYDDGFDPAIWSEPQETEPGPFSAPPPEPPGFEDAVEIYLRGPQTPSPAPFGSRRPPPRTKEDPPRHAPSNAQQPAPRYGNAAAGFDVEPDGAEHPPVRIGAARRAYGEGPPTAPAPLPLTVREKLDVVRKVGALVGGPSGYAMTHADGTDLVWGLVGFRQSAGTLGDVLDVLRTSAPDELRAAFGASADRLVGNLTAPDPATRMALVENTALVDPTWQSRFESAARIDAVKFAQNRAAVERILDPLVGAVAAVAPLTDRNLGLALAAGATLGVPETRARLARSIDGLGAPAAGTALGEWLTAIRSSPSFNDSLFERG